MRIVLFKSFLIGSLALAFAMALICVLVPAFGETMRPIAWVSAIACSYAIGMPVACYFFWQSDRLGIALGELEIIHAKLSAAHEQLSEKSRRDPMTGMLNRENFLKSLETLRRSADRGVLLIADIDHFKAINDNWGHLTGDVALKLIAAAIVRSVRGHDIVGRLGGEEFAVYLPGANRRQASVVAERIRSSVAALTFNPAENVSKPLSISIGGAASRPDSAMSELMRNADRRLYEAKNGGRNRTVMDVPLKRAA